MPPNRNDLLDQLREASSLGRETEQRLRHVLSQAPASDEQRSEMKNLLTQTIEQQRLLGQSVMRIEDTGTPAGDAVPEAPATPAGPAAGDDRQSPSLIELRDALLREVDFYADLIATAEITGFFETKWVCEGILSQKSSTVAWLGTASRPNQPKRSQ